MYNQTMQVSLPEWEDFLKRRAQQGTPIHLLQTGAWGQLKSGFGWEPVRLICGDTGAQVLLRTLVPRLGRFSPRVAYLPRGPVGGNWSEVLPARDALCRARRAVFLKIEPDYWEEEVPPELNLPALGLRLSPHAIQPPRTVVIDISVDEERILAQMKQKTRYNVRLAQKKGITIRACADMQIFHELMQVTGQRDGFGVHSQAYYQRAYELFHRGVEPQSLPAHVPACELLLAEFEGQPLAALMVFACGKRSYYLYGASNDLHREKMPTYLLQWEAMLWARRRGCSEYDLWGIPDEDEETLEAHFAERHDGLWGVYRFKRGYGGRILRAAGPWERVYQPPLYQLYQWRVSRQQQAPMGG